MRATAKRSSLVAWLLLSICSGTMLAQSLEYEVKAAMIFNFAKFVSWPERSVARSGPMIVGVVGENPFGGALDRLVKAGTINGREMRILRFERADQLVRCEILFIARSETARLPKILAQLRGQPVLTIGDSEGFAEAGGVVGFVLEGNRVRFEVNVEAARLAGLEVSSKLLRLAKIVGERGD